jgi:hypothetical protein
MLLLLLLMLPAAAHAVIGCAYLCSDACSGTHGRVEECVRGVGDGYAVVAVTGGVRGGEGCGMEMRVACG